MGGRRFLASLCGDAALADDIALGVVFMSRKKEAL